MNETWGQQLLGRVQGMGLKDTPLEHACGSFALAEWAEGSRLNPIIPAYLLILAERWLEVYYAEQDIAAYNIYYARLCTNIQKRRAAKSGKRKASLVSR